MSVSVYDEYITNPVGLCLTFTYCYVAIKYNMSPLHTMNKRPSCDDVQMTRGSKNIFIKEYCTISLLLQGAAIYWRCVILRQKHGITIRLLVIINSWSVNRHCPESMSGEKTIAPRVGRRQTTSRNRRQNVYRGSLVFMFARALRSPYIIKRLQVQQVVLYYNAECDKNRFEHRHNTYCTRWKMTKITEEAGYNLVQVCHNHQYNI